MSECSALLALACALGAACANARDAVPVDTPRVAPPPDRIVVEQFGAAIYAASGVTQQGDGRVLVAEDTKRHPLVVLDLFGRGTAKALTPEELARATGRKWLSDLEGITSDDRGRVYAVTSHSLTSNGAEREERELLVRFEIDADTVANARVGTGLKDAICALDPVLARGNDKRPKRRGEGLNIEGIALGPADDRLMLGVRSPLIGNSAVAISLDNITDVFEHAAVPRLSGPFLLALDGQGIRDLAWDATLGGYLVVAGAARRSSRGEAALWFWRGPKSVPIRLDAPAIADLKPEGIALVQVGGHRAVLLVCDDGSPPKKYSDNGTGADDGTPSRYIVIPYDTLIARNAARLASAATSKPH